jgi:hypothetical protein
MLLNKNLSPNVGLGKKKLNGKFFKKNENISKEYSLSKKQFSHFKWQNLAPKDMLIGTLKSTHHAT